MYSVVLTELGISVFNDGQVDKSFAFSNPVKEYLAIKSKEAKLNELINYLAKIQRGVSVSDESLLAILKKFSIDCHIMNLDELEKVQTTKPQIIVDSGFASNLQDTLGKLREFALGFSSSKVTEVSQSPDLHIIQAINSLDEIDKIANGLSSRLREWYGLHFPELDNMIDSINGYAQIVMAGKRESLSKQVFEEAGFPESKVEMLSLILSKSRGGDISDINLAIVQSIAKQILDFHELRKKLEEHVESEMVEIAPNLSAILGSAVGARILGRAGSLKKMASMPASTIQVLGAEKALFRALKTGSQPPKHGLLFQHAMVHAAPRWQRGKIARAVAAKAVIAARVDVYGEGLNQTLLDKLNIRVDEIGKKYENPTEKDIRKPQQFRQDEGNFGGRREGGRREGGRREGGRREGGRREGGRREGGRREGGRCRRRVEEKVVDLMKEEEKVEIETKDPVMVIEEKVEIETKDPVMVIEEKVEIETKDPVMVIEEKVEIETKDPVMVIEEKVEIETKDPVMVIEEKVEIETKDPVMVKEEEKVQTQIEREKSLEEDNQSYFWIKSEGEQKISTENLVPGNQVYKEKLIIKKGIEYRLWDPFRSKLAASIMNRLENFPFKNKTKVLYLGASTGTTVSHISDIVGPGGLVFAVEHASRVARDFLDRVATHRPNIMPILQDARKPKEYFSVFGKVDVVYVDIAQPDQTQIAIDNCDMFLKKDGFFFLVIKTRSIDVTKAPKRIVQEEIEKLREKFEILESIDLHPYDKDHAMVIAKYKN